MIACRCFYDAIPILVAKKQEDDNRFTKDKISNEVAVVLKTDYRMVSRLSRNQEKLRGEMEQGSAYQKRR
jgi:hypothetical protein